MIGSPGRTRTCNLVVNSHPLLPVELPGKINSKGLCPSVQINYTCNIVVNPAIGGIPLLAGLSYRGIISLVYMKTLKKTMGKIILEASIHQQVVDLARGEIN